jgi:hypothetical protein
LSYVIINSKYIELLVMANKQLTLDEKQVTLDDWMIERLRDKLGKAAANANRTGKPILLYRNIIEENEAAAEEEVATVSEKNAIVQVFTYGGFIPPTFQQQHVFRLDEFPMWVMKRGRNLLLQCLENLE